IAFPWANPAAWSPGAGRAAASCARNNQAAEIRQIAVAATKGVFIRHLPRLCIEAPALTIRPRAGAAVNRKKALDQAKEQPKKTPGAQPPIVTTEDMQLCLACQGRTQMH